MNTRWAWALVGLIAAAPAMASSGRFDEARVVDVQPEVRTIRVSTPRQECWQERVTHREPRYRESGVPTVVGALIGGALGNAVGHHSTNKKVGAVVGAVLGGTIGAAHGRGRYNEDYGYSSVEERCEVVEDYEEREQITGYRVRYEYGGEIYTTRMDRDPGETVRVRVTVAAVE